MFAAKAQFAAWKGKERVRDLRDLVVLQMRGGIKSQGPLVEGNS